MAYNMGSGSQLAIGKEGAGSWGTAVTDTMLVNFSSESLAVEVTKTEEESLLAAKAAAAYDLLGMKVSGDFSAVLKPENAGFFMKAALGGTDTLTNPSGQYLHTIVAQAAATAMPSYTIYVNRKQATKKYSGCKVASLKIAAKAGDYVKATVSVKGKDEATGSITTSTVPSLKAYKFIGGTVTAGGTSLEVTSCELSIDNGLEDGPQTNTSGLYATEPNHGKRKIQLTVETPYDANAETIRTTNFLTETVLATVVLHLESPSIITATYKYRMDVTLNNVAVLDQKTNVGGSGLITTSYTMEATAVGATEPISAAIYDATSSAY